MSIGTTDPRYRHAWGAEHSKTVEWHAPGPGAAEGSAMAGDEYMRAMMDGQLPPPPISTLFNIRCESVEQGRVAMTCEVDESMYNATGLVHGGVVCTLLDTVTGCAVLSMLEAGKAVASIEIKVNYIRAVHPKNSPLLGVGTVVKIGARMGFAEGVVTDTRDAVVATASSTVFIVEVGAGKSI
jgi:uncharacterized protein (TIGR00369 family)